MNVIAEGRQVSRRDTLKKATASVSAAMTAYLLRSRVHGAHALIGAAAVDPRIQGPFLILSTPFTASGAVDFEALARQACYVDWCGVSGYGLAAVG